MALGSTALGHGAASYRDLVGVLLIVVAVIIFMLLMTAVFGVHQAGPSYEVVPDPAAAVGLPF